MKFVELIRKDNNEPIAIELGDITVFNPDVDGVGTMLITKSGVVRVVTEDYKTIKAAMGFTSFQALAAQAAAPKKGKK